MDYILIVKHQPFMNENGMWLATITMGEVIYSIPSSSFVWFQKNTATQDKRNKILVDFIAYSVYLQHHPHACQEQSCRTKSSLHHQVLTSTFRPRGYIADLEGSLWCLLSENQSHSMRFSSSPLFSSALLSHKAQGWLWNMLSHTTGFSSV